MNVADRKNGSAHLMTADEARGIIAAMERQIKSPSKRKELAAKLATNIAGRLSDDAISVYRNYSI